MKRIYFFFFLFVLFGFFYYVQAAEVKIQDDVEGYAPCNSERSLVVDSNENTYVCYIDHDGTANRVYVEKSTDGGDTWSPIGNPVDSSNVADYCAIAIDSSNYLHLVYAGTTNVYYSKYTGTWSSPETIDNNPGTGRPDIVIDSSENPHVVYCGTGTGITGYHCWYTTRNGSWSTPTRCDLPTTKFDAYGQNCDSALAIDGSGNLHLVWSGLNSDFETYYQIFYSEYDGSWSDAISITDEINFYDQSNSISPSIAIDSSNYLHVVFEGDNNDVSGYKHIHYTKYTTSWSSSTNISSDLGNYNQYNSSISIASTGDIFAFWSGTSSTYPGGKKICYSSYDTSWTSPSFLNTDKTLYDISKHSVLWQRTNMNLTGSIYYNFMDSGADLYFDKIAILPADPTNVSWSTITSSSIKITWTDNASNETGYKVDHSVNGTSWSLEATLAADTEDYTDTGLDINTIHYYRVYAYNDSGESAKVQPSPTFKYTYAVTPSQPIVSANGVTTLSVNPDKGSNPSATKMAIKVDTQWVQANGSLGESEVWQDDSTWGIVTVTGLSADTQYNIQEKARNEDSVETSLTTAVNCYTYANAPTGPSVTGAWSQANGVYCTVTWSSGGSEDHFHVYYSGDNYVSELHNSATTTLVHTNLSEYTAYIYRIFGVNGDGVENPSYATDSCTTPDLPDVSITNVSHATDGTGHITITYSITDQDSSSFSLTDFDYSINDGGSWNDVADGDWGGGDGKSGLTTGSHTIIWYSQNNVNNTESSTIKILIVVNDGTYDGTGTSSSFTIDNKAPYSISLSINSGDQYCTSCSVTLTIAASDASSMQMKFKNESGGTFGSYETYNTTRSWTLTACDVSGTKTVYIKLRDAYGNESDGSHNDTIYLSLTGPTGTLSIDTDATYCTSISVTLTISASTGAGGSLTHMRFSNDGVWDTESWETYDTTRSWTLLATDGTKTVYAQYKDSNDLVSGTISDSIILDSTAPTGSISINSGASETTTVSVTLTISATDAVGSVENMRLSNDNTNWEAWETYVTSKSFTLLPLAGLKTVYIQFQDAAGNTSSSFTDTIYYQEERIGISGPSGPSAPSPIPPTTAPPLTPDYLTDEYKEIKQKRVEFTWDTFLKVTIPQYLFSPRVLLLFGAVVFLLFVRGERKRDFDSSHDRPFTKGGFGWITLLLILLFTFAYSSGWFDGIFS